MAYISSRLGQIPEGTVTRPLDGLLYINLPQKTKIFWRLYQFASPPNKGTEDGVHQKLRSVVVLLFVVRSKWIARWNKRDDIQDSCDL